MFRLQVKTHFDAAHQLQDYMGKCNRLHGHRWEVEVCLQGQELNDCNMLIDFKEVKRVLDFWLDECLDHHDLNSMLDEANPTAEFLAKWLFDKLLEAFIGYPVKLVRVCIWESPDCCVKYSPDMKSTNG